jgi:hypothetical protein
MTGGRSARIFVQDSANAAARYGVYEVPDVRMSRGGYNGHDANTNGRVPSHFTILLSDPMPRSRGPYIWYHISSESGFIVVSLSASIGVESVEVPGFFCVLVHE